MISALSITSMPWASAFSDFFEDPCARQFGGVYRNQSILPRPTPMVIAADIDIQLAYRHPFQEMSDVSINGSPFQPVLCEPRCLLLRQRYSQDIRVTRPSPSRC